MGVDWWEIMNAVMFIIYLSKKTLISIITECLKCVKRKVSTKNTKEHKEERKCDRIHCLIQTYAKYIRFWSLPYDFTQ